MPPLRHPPQRSREARLLSGLMVAACLVLAPGCAAFRPKNPVSDGVAQCRQFSRQGATARESGDLGKAETLLRQAVGASPTDSDSRQQLAETLWSRGEHSEAIRHMQSASELEPHCPLIAIRHGEMLLSAGQPNAALAEAERALAENPRAAEAWALRGRVYLATGDADRGLADLHQSLHRNPTARGVLVDVAWLHREKGQRHRELTTLHRLRDTYVPGEEPVELVAGEADAYLALGRPQEAVERLRDACGRGAPSAPLLCRLAEAEEAAGDPRRAWATAQQALAADANYGPTHQLVARLSQSAIR